MNTVIIGCKLPHGITLHGTAGQEIHINGVNTSLVAGGFGLTNVDESEAAYLFAQYDDFAPFKSKAIFSYGTDSVADVAAMASELADIQTGFEGMNPDKPAPNMAPENDAALNKAKEDSERNPRPATAPAAKADKAAAKKLAGKA